MDSEDDLKDMKKTLEWELSLDSADLRSHAWYHGAIPRHHAEDILTKDGDFLVRDCISQPGDFVLTCRWVGAPLHFVINKVVLQPDTIYERVEYQLEDDTYDSIPGLVTCYVGSGNPISNASGARIITPRNRSCPLSFYATKYGADNQLRVAAGIYQGQGTLTRSGYKGFQSPLPSRDSPPKLPVKQRSVSGQSVVQAAVARINQSLGDQKERCSVDGGVGKGISPPSVISHNIQFSTHSLPRSGLSKQLPQWSKMVRVTSDPSLSPSTERRKQSGNNRIGHLSQVFPTAEMEPDGESPPPKPSRLPSTKSRPPDKDNDRNPLTEVLQITEDSDSKEAAIDVESLEEEVKSLDKLMPVECDEQRHSGTSSPRDGQGGVRSQGSSGDGPITPRQPQVGVIIPPLYQPGGSDSGNGSGDSVQDTEGLPKRSGVLIEYDSAVEEIVLFTLPDLSPTSQFDLENFQTLLLPSLENKPLDITALQGVLLCLKETASRILANHLLRVDLDVLHGIGDYDMGLGVSSGIELLTLPQGKQLRADIYERLECLKLFVAMTLLRCPSVTERAELLHKWIQVAVDTKTALGNLYSYCGIMMGLTLPQIERLSVTWHTLRQKYTDSAFNFEAKLRPTLKYMNDCTNPQAPNTTIPHLLPLILMFERSVDDFLSPSQSWEITSGDFGLFLLHQHLEQARQFTQNLTMYQRNAEIVLADVKYDDLVLDTFKTEFHLKFLWGSRGAIVAQTERLQKFHQVLTVMSETVEP